MWRNRTLAILGVAGVLALQLAANEQASESLESMIDAPREFLGASVASIVERLGEPNDAATKIGRNRHDRMIPNVAVKLTYDDWEVETLFAMGVNKWFLETVRARRSALVQLGLRSGSAPEEAIELLGQPDQESDVELRYVCCPDSETGSDTLVLRYGAGGLESAFWNYFME